MHGLKNIWLVIITTSCIFCQLVAAQGKTDREQSSLDGPVRSVETGILDFTIKDAKTEPGNRRAWLSVTYNSAGNIVEKTQYDPMGKFLERLVYAYDLRGRSIGYDEYTPTSDKGSAIPRKHIYTIDDLDNRLEYKVLESDGSIAIRFTYEYDAKGNKTASSTYFHTGAFGGKTTFTFDDKGNQIGEAYSDARGSDKWKSISKFDEKGRQTERLNYENEKLRYKFVSTYDGRGRILINDTFEFNAVTDPNVLPASHAPRPGKVVYIYKDDIKSKEVTTYLPDGSLSDRVVYKYDSKGSEIEVARFKSDGSPEDTSIGFYDNESDVRRSQFRGTLQGKSVFEFEYDSHGNWTKKTFLIQTSKTDKPQAYRAEERIIKYY